MKITEKIKVKSKQPNKIEEVVLNLKPSPLEILCPFELKEGKSVIFRINGKQKVGNEIVEVYNSFPLGVLLGRNSSCGEEGFFAIYNGQKYTPTKKGGLFLKFNYDWYGKYEVNEEISVIISLAHQITDMIMLYKSIGFENCKSLYDNDKKFMDFKFFINLLRSEPAKFGDIYLKHLSKENKNIESLIKELSNMKKLNAFQSDQLLYKLSEELCSDLVLNKKFSHYDSKGRNLRSRADDIFYRKYTRKSGKEKETFKDLKESIMMMSEKYIENDESFQLSIVLKLIIDELVPSLVNRKNLLNENLHYLGYTIMNHESFGSICVIVFSEKQYIKDHF